MKKSATSNQSGKVKAEALSVNAAPGRKVVYDHKACDHYYGRINKHAIGINHEPGIF